MKVQFRTLAIGDEFIYRGLHAVRIEKVVSDCGCSGGPDILNARVISNSQKISVPKGALVSRVQ